MDVAISFEYELLFSDSQRIGLLSLSQFYWRENTIFIAYNNPVDLSLTNLTHPKLPLPSEPELTISKSDTYLLGNSVLHSFLWPIALINGILKIPIIITTFLRTITYFLTKWTI